MKKRGLALGLVLALSLCLGALGAEGQRFADVPGSHWAYGAIQGLVERKAINGYPDENFYPERTVSREEFAKIMVAAAGITPKPVERATYEDVPLGYWAVGYIEAARPYMTAYQKQGKLWFYPTSGALREDIAVAVIALRGFDTAKADLSLLEAMFTDLESISPAARPYVALAVELGIITGYTDRTFRGQGTITRAEAAAILWRAFQQGSGDKVIPGEILPSATPEPTPSVTPAPTPTPTPVPTPEPPPEPTPVPEATIDKCVFISAVDKGTDQIRGIFIDGTTKIISVDGKGMELREGDLIFCQEGRDGTYEVFGMGQTITARYDPWTGTFGGMKVAKDCVLFAEVTAASTGDVNARYVVYSIREMEDIPAQRAVFAQDEAGQVVAVYMDLDRAPGEIRDTMYGFVTSKPEFVKLEDKTYATYTVWIEDGEIDVLEEDGRGTVAKKGEVISFDYMGDGTINNVTRISKDDLTNAYALVGLSGDNIRLIDSKGTESSVVKIDTNTVILYVNTKDDTGVEGGQLEIAVEYKDGQYLLNMWVVARPGAETKADLIVIDVLDDIDNYDNDRNGITERPAWRQ